MKKILTLVIFMAVAVLSHAAAVSVTTLRAEQLDNPLGLDTATPRLGWVIVSDGQNVMQTSYRILVASSPEFLAKDEGDLWDTGRVKSDQSQWIAYAGKPLGRNARAYWKVKSYTTAGESDWSETAFFGVGLNKETYWAGQWIGMERPAPWDDGSYFSRLSARYLRKEFALTKPVSRATLYIAGLGLYEAYLNGEKIGDAVLAPAPTDYRKTVLYNTYDVTSQLSSDNALGVILGNGNFYTMRQDSNLHGGSEWVNFGYPKMRLNLIIEYEDGTTQTIVSDKSWKLTADGPIRSNNEYDGEEYDASKELGAWTSAGYDDSTWTGAEKVAAPTGTLRGAMAPNIRIVDTVNPVSITPLGDKYIIDMGQNFTGWLRIRVKGGAGDVITMRFAETLQDSGEIYTANLRTAKVTDRYICSGDEGEGATWAPKFSFHGFRYVELSGYDDPQPGDFIGEVVTDGMETTGSFECSDATLNSIYHNCYWGILSNYKGMPLDCPQRDEREPWLGDRGMGAWGESYVFGNGMLYSKWTRDICEAQREDGNIPGVAPAFWLVYNNDVTWPFALPSVCDMLYTRYGNLLPIVRAYPYLQRFVAHQCEDFMTEDFIFTKDQYGDWCVPPESLELIHSKDPTRVTEGALLSTAYMVKVAQLMQRFATLQGLSEDVKKYAELERKITEGFNAKYLKVDGSDVHYANNTVTANILPLAFGMVPDEYEDTVAENMVKVIMDANGGHVSCGVIGMQWLLKELSKRGHADIAWLLATNTSYPSWGYMVGQGATTVWELWNGNTAAPSMNSGNHVMLIGDLVSWCYENLGGIRPDYTIGNTGYKRIILAPDFGIEGADYANVSYNSIYGLIGSSWSKDRKGDIEWNVTVPANTTAEVHLPDGRIEIVGSGNYTYKVNK